MANSREKAGRVTTSLQLRAKKEAAAVETIAHISVITSAKQIEAKLNTVVNNHKKGMIGNLIAGGYFSWAVFNTINRLWNFTLCERTEAGTLRLPPGKSKCDYPGPEVEVGDIINFICLTFCIGNYVYHAYSNSSRGLNAKDHLSPDEHARLAKLAALQKESSINTATKMVTDAADRARDILGHRPALMRFFLRSDIPNEAQVKIADFLGCKNLFLLSRELRKQGAATNTEVAGENMAAVPPVANQEIIPTSAGRQLLFSPPVVSLAIDDKHSEPALRPSIARRTLTKQAKDEMAAMVADQFRLR